MDRTEKSDLFTLLVLSLTDLSASLKEAESRGRLREWSLQAMMAVLVHMGPPTKDKSQQHGPKQEMEAASALLAIAFEPHKPERLEPMEGEFSRLLSQPVSAYVRNSKEFKCSPDIHREIRHSPPRLHTIRWLLREADVRMARGEYPNPIGAEFFNQLSIAWLLRYPLERRVAVTANLDIV